jgi:hypothetical protein
MSVAPPSGQNRIMIYGPKPPASLMEQCLGLLQIKGGETFGEPAVDRGEKIAWKSRASFRLP